MICSSNALPIHSTFQFSGDALAVVFSALSFFSMLKEIAALQKDLQAGLPSQREQQP